MLSSSLASCFRGRKTTLPAFVALLFMFTAGVRAQSDSLLGLVAPQIERKSAIRLEVPADVLTFQVQILSSTDDWEVRLSEVESAREVLRALAEKQGFRLVALQGVRLDQGYGKLFSSSGRSEIDVKSSVLLVAPLEARSDLVELMRRARVLLTRSSLPKGVKLGLGEVRLGLEDVERHRAPLLKKIREHIDLTSGALGTSTDIEVTGLDEPLVLRPASERGVELSLPLKVTYTRKGK